MREGLLILGDHLPNPHTGAKTTPAQRHRQIVEIAVRAEALGFDSVWLGEHHLCDYVLSSPPVVLAAIAERTTRLRLGTGVTLLGSLDPVRVAEDYATLDALSNGRAEVVAGRGILRRTYADFGHDPDQSRELFEENVAILLAAWSESVFLRGRAPRAAARRHGAAAPAADAAATAVDRRRQLRRIGGPRCAARPSAHAAERARSARRVRTLCPALPRELRGARPRARAARRRRVQPRARRADSQTARTRWRPYHMQYVRWVTTVLIPWAV